MQTSGPTHADRVFRMGPSQVVLRPALLERLEASDAEQVTLVSAPPGSGKTVLLRSWIERAGLLECVAWVSVERGERDPQQFWLRVVEQLRASVCPDGFIETRAHAPIFDGSAFVGRLISELSSLGEPVVLVIDDLHELHSPEALAQLERLLADKPPLLRVVLATRRDPQLGLHRLRLAGNLIEIRAADLRFTLEETRQLLLTSGITLSEERIALLHARTEGWVAGLRLAVLSLTGHPDPERFVAEFSGSERTVADYLLAEVLARQPEEVRRLLLRTSILERVSGPLADALVGSSGSERILLALEQANAFVVALDAGRAWFRYHHLFTDLLRLELRRTAPEVIKDLHRTASAWYAVHEEVVEAVRHALGAEDWEMAAGLLADHITGLLLKGQDVTVGALLAAFPEDARSDPQLNVVCACHQLIHGSLDDAAAYIALAEQRTSALPDERRHRVETLLVVARLSLAVRGGDFDAVPHDVRPLLEPAFAKSVGELAVLHDLRAVAFMNLGIAELWSWRIDEAIRHLERGCTLGRRLELPYVETASLSHLALAVSQRSLTRGRERALEAVTVAEAYGWADEPVVSVALATLGAVDVWQARFADGEAWLDLAERAIPPDLEPTSALLVHLTRGVLYLGQGRLEPALAALRDARDCQSALVVRHALSGQVQQFRVYALLRLGEPAAARAALSELAEEERASGEGRAATASFHLSNGNPQAACDALAPVLEGGVPSLGTSTVIQALLLTALARDRLGDQQATANAIERALDLAEPDALIFPFVLILPRDLLARHPRHRTAHAALLADVLDVHAGVALPGRSGTLGPPREDLSESELRVLRFLPSNLSAPEIANELFLSTSTVKTHMRHIYAKLGVHRRTEAVERARLTGLLAPSARGHR